MSFDAIHAWQIANAYFKIWPARASGSWMLMLVEWSHHGQTVPTSCCRGSTSKFWWNPVYSRIAVSPSRGGGTATVHISKPCARLSKPSPMTSRLRPCWGPVQESHWGKVSWQWNFQLHTQVLLRLRVWQISNRDNHKLPNWYWI
jgi:hypothetical protein